MKTRNKKTTRKAPTLPSPSALDGDVRGRLYDAVSGMAGEETVCERLEDGSHTGVMTVELRDGSVYRVTVEVAAGWDDWCLTGAELVN